MVGVGVGVFAFKMRNDESTEPTIFFSNFIIFFFSIICIFILNSQLTRRVNTNNTHGDQGNHFG